jgi:hypothetical protein
MTILIGEANNIYYNVPPVAGGSGFDATFDVYRDETGDISSIEVVKGGQNYNVGETLTIDGANIGGSSGTDDIRFTISNIVEGSTGGNNNFFGQSAGESNISGCNNNFFGLSAGQNNTTGSSNNFFGPNAGCNNTTECFNNFIGFEAGKGRRGRITSVGITTFTTLVGEADNFYSDVSGTGGDGSNATFNVDRDVNGDVSLVNTGMQGYNYNVGNTLTIDGSDVGGSSGTDDITITVNEVISSTGSNNNFIGKCAGQYNTGNGNNFIGSAAGRYNITGNGNNFLGVNAGLRNISGKYNNFFGPSAGYYNTTGCNNNFFGRFAGVLNSTGSNNNFFGRDAGYYNTTGTHNTFLGSYSGISTSASRKIIIGSGFGFGGLVTLDGAPSSNHFDSPDTTKDTQFAVGLRTDANPSKYWLVGNENFNVGIGTTNPQTKLEINGVLGFSDRNARIGDVFTGASITTGCNNNFFGNSAGRGNTTGCNNNFIGFNAGRGVIGIIDSVGITSFTTLVGEANNSYSDVSGTGGAGSDATFYVERDGSGDVTIVNIATGGYDYNVGDILTIDGGDVGGSSGTDDVTITITTTVGESTGSNNNFIGESAGYYNTTGSQNNFLGSSAGYYNTDGGDNNFFGRDAGRRNSTGSDNNFLGKYAGFHNTTGGYNNFFGACAGYTNTTGSLNNFIGAGAGRGVIGIIDGINLTSSTAIIGEANNTYSGVSATGGLGIGQTSATFFVERGGLEGQITSIGITSFTTLVGEANNSYSNALGTGGDGSNATFYVERDGIGDIGTIDITIGGYDYNVGNILTIDGSDVGGSSGTDDVTITIDEVVITESGAVIAVNIVTGSQNYNVGDILTINGSDVGGSSGTDNITITITSTTVVESTVSANNFFGAAAGFQNTGCYNNFFGTFAGARSTGDFNNFFGTGAGKYNTTGCNSGSQNNFFGTGAGRYNTTGCNNNFFGSYAGRNNTTGESNNFFGRDAGKLNTTGCGNNFFGSWSGISTSASRKIIIGFGESNNYFDSPDTTKDNQFAVGIRTDANPANYWLVGDENFNVGIGTTNLTEKLTVGGNIALNNNVVYGSVNETSYGITPTIIHSGLSTSIYRSVDYTIQAINDTNYQVTKILALHDGLVGYSTTISNLYNNIEVATFNVLLGELETVGITTFTTLIGEADTTYSDISATGGSGFGAIFEVFRGGSGDVSSVTISYGGQEYQVGDTLIIDGGDVGGSSSTDDIELSVDSINENIILVSTASTNSSHTDYTINFAATKTYITQLEPS